jgi:hypothetical protein
MFKKTWNSEIRQKPADFLDFGISAGPNNNYCFALSIRHGKDKDDFISPCAPSAGIKEEQSIKRTHYGER